MDTVAAIVKNAQRLLDDARLLAANGSYRTAESLAILSMEESGKACLVHWKLKGYLTTDIREELRGHLDKQRVLRAYRFIAAIKSFAVIVPEDDPRAVFAFPRDVLMERTYAEFARTTRKHIITIDSGLHEYMKQHGFYTDINDDLELVKPVLPFSAEGFSHADELAVEHLMMTGANEDTHKRAAAVYRVNSWPKLSKKQRDKVLKAMLDAYVPPPGEAGE